MSENQSIRVSGPPPTALLSGISNDGDGNLDTKTALSPYNTMTIIIIPKF